MAEREREHEFVADERRWRVSSVAGGWTLEVRDQRDRYWYEADIEEDLNYTAMLDIAAEIARLKGLVPPGGAE